MVADKLMSGANLELMRLATEKALELNGSDDNNSDTNDENSAADVEDDVFMDPEESEDLILMPGFSVFRWYWDIVRLLGLLFYITIVPIRFIHVEMNGFDPSLVVGWLFDLFFFVDIVLNMLVFSFVIDKETNLFADRNLIRQFYLQSWDFIVDVCSVFFFPAVLIILAVQSESSWKHVKILRCFALIRTPHFSRYLGTVLKSIKKTEGEGTEPSILKNQNLQNVANIVLYQLIIIYWSACIWLGLSQWIYADDANKNWLFYFEIVHPATTLYEKYISALSWSSSTLYSVGYGNTYARNDWERVLSVTVMIFGFVMQNSLIGFLVPFLKARTIDRIQFQNRVRSLADMIRSKALDQKESLQEGDGFLYGQVLTNARYLSKIAEKVTQYREYIWIRQKGRHENSVLDDMPEHLRLDLLLASCGEALTK